MATHKVQTPPLLFVCLILCGVDTKQELPDRFTSELVLSILRKHNLLLMTIPRTNDKLEFSNQTKDQVLQKKCEKIWHEAAIALAGPFLTASHDFLPRAISQFIYLKK